MASFERKFGYFNSAVFILLYNSVLVFAIYGISPTSISYNNNPTKYQSTE